MTVVFDDYLEALLSANTSAAIELLDDALMRGTSPVSLIRDIIGRGQQEIGESWARGSLSLGEEHAATAVSEQALAVVSQSLPASPRGKRVALACAEGEWHTMPARLAGAQARAAGLQVTMLGASLPADQLQAHLLRTAPDVLALSVTLSSNLVGASKSIQAAHRAGVAVIVGGAAWGTDDLRARALGADHWLGDVSGFAQVVDAVLAHDALVVSPLVATEAVLLAEAPPTLAAQAMDRHLAQGSPEVLSPEQLDERLLDYAWLRRYTASALACADPTILAEMLERWAASLARHACDPHWVVAACGHLAAVTDPVAPAASVLLRRVGEQHAATRSHEASRPANDVRDDAASVGVPRWQGPVSSHPAHR